MKQSILIVIITVVITSASTYLLLQTRPQTFQQDTEQQEEMKKSPVPKIAMGVAIDQEKGFLVEEIRDGLYWITDGTYQVMFLTTGEGVVIVDSPPNLGEKILDAVAEVTDEAITHVIYSHSHADHIAMASIYPENAVYIAHEETAAQIERANTQSRPAPFGAFIGGTPVPTPTQTFTDTFTLNVGNQILELKYLGPAHESGNIFIYAPSQKVLMVVDVVFPGWVPFKELAVAEDVSAFIAVHDQILSYDFDTFIGGHLTRLGTRQDVETQKEYISDIQTNAVKALQTVDFFKIAGEVGFENQWLLFDTYLDELTNECVEATLKKWNDKLGGADVFTDGHCARIIESLRLD